MVRFDDSLDTVLASDLRSPMAAQAAWRQLVDLIGRQRVVADRRAIERLYALRDSVPVAVRAASARAIETAAPPAPLVRLLAVDEDAVAIPVLRTGQMTGDEWVALIPRLSPTARMILRNRRDLGLAAIRILEQFQASDFVLPDHGRHARAAQPIAPGASSLADPASVGPVGPAISEGPFRIADVVARIDAFQQRRRDRKASDTPYAAPTASDVFRFETDTQGRFVMVDGVTRGPIVGLALDRAAAPGGAGVDAAAASAFARRATIDNARMIVAGQSDAAGEWRISATALFDAATGRFSGYRGTARRPRIDETAGSRRPLAPAAPSADSLRQLVHELRTPTHAISGFAEMIESELLGPVPEVYRVRAGEIRRHVRALIEAIDDLDLAARLETHALPLHEERVDLQPLLRRCIEDLAPLAELRGAAIDLAQERGATLRGDGKAIERLFGRLFATMLGAAGQDERLGVRVAVDGDDMVMVAVDRPRSFAAYQGDAIFALDDEREDITLLGTGFALRLVHNLARELGGSLMIGRRRLTLRLPAAFTRPMEQAHHS